MFTKNLIFKDKELKKQYHCILNNHPALYSVMIREFNLNDNTALVEEINKELYGINIVVNSNNNMVIVTIDFINKKIKIQKPNLSYKTIYPNYGKKFVAPDGYEYRNGYNGRRVFKQHLVRPDTVHANDNILILREFDKTFNIYIEGNYNNLDINSFIEKLLQYKEDITNIKDLLLFINSTIDLTYFQIKLSDDKGNLINIAYGELKDYVEYRETEEENQKIFLKNDEFLIERQVKEQYKDEDVASLMKKIGVYNGKKERKD